MPANRKPKKHYRPRAVVRDTVGLVTRRLTHDAGQALKIAVRNHVAAQRFTTGTATPDDWQEIAGAIAMGYALAVEVYGGGYADEMRAAQQANDEAWRRYERTGVFGYTGPQLQAVNLGLAIHDAQLEQCTGGDLERAFRLVALAEQQRKTVPS